MTSCPSPNSASFTASRPIRSANGSKDSACEHQEVSLADRHLPMALSASGQAGASAPTITFGTPTGPPPSSTRWATPELDGPFMIRSSGNIGQEILDADGRVVAWTTDEWIGRVICRLLNEHEELLR